jgi:hypothetical protein
MTLKVDPAALRVYSRKLSALTEAADTARRYVNNNANLSLTEGGLLGYIVGSHRSYVDALNRMLDHLARVTDASSDSMNEIGDTYDRTDKHSAEELDATYPETVRPHQNQDPWDDRQNRPPPPSN